MSRRSLKTAEREKIFVKNYLEKKSAAEAAIAAGYSPATARQGAYQILQKPRVKNLIQQKISAAEKLVDENFVVKKLIEVANFCIDNKIAKYDSNGQLVGESIDSAGANRALELLGKYLKLWDDRVRDISVFVNDFSLQILKLVDNNLHESCPHCGHDLNQKILIADGLQKICDESRQQNIDNPQGFLANLRGARPAEVVDSVK